MEVREVGCWEGLEVKDSWEDWVYNCRKKVNEKWIESLFGSIKSSKGESLSLYWFKGV